MGNGRKMVEGNGDRVAGKIWGMGIGIGVWLERWGGGGGIGEGESSVVVACLGGVYCG